MSTIKALYATLKQIVKDDTKTYAKSPRKFTAKDWKNVLAQTKNDINVKRIGVLAAGIAYFATLAVFPAIAATVAIFSFVVSKSQLNMVFESIEMYLPADIAQLISTQLMAALESPSSGIIIIIIGIFISLFSLSGAVSNVIKAINTIYETDETRKFIKLRLTSLAFIIGAGIIALAAVGLLVLNDNYLESIGIPGFIAGFIIVVRWVFIAALVSLGLSLFYRYAPNRRNPQWRWVTWGSAIAAVIWLLGTSLFFLYARYFAHFSQSYSVFAGIIVLMIWFNLTSFALLIGGEINFRLEKQTRAVTQK